MRDTFFPKTMAIRVPSFVTRLVAAELPKRDFLKSDGRGNENEFYNKMLPNMLAYRAQLSPCAAGTLHGAKPCFILHATRRASLKKALAFASAFFLSYPNNFEPFYDPSFYTKIQAITDLLLFSC